MLLVQTVAVDMVLVEHPMCVDVTMDGGEVTVPIDNAHTEFRGL